MPCKVNNYVDSRMSIASDSRSFVLPSKEEVKNGGTLEPSQIEKHKSANEQVHTTESSEESDPDGSQSPQFCGKGLVPHDYMLIRNRTKRKVKPNKKFGLA